MSLFQFESFSVEQIVCVCFQFFDQLSPPAKWKLCVRLYVSLKSQSNSQLFIKNQKAKIQHTEEFDLEFSLFNIAAVFNSSW